MEIQKRIRGGRVYYYLVHSYREGRRVRKLERYLGRTPPKETSAIREEFLLDLFSREFGARLNVLRSSSRAVARATPLSIRRKNLEAFAARFTYDSNRIEGSTLTLRDTTSLLEDGVTPPNRPLSDVREALAHQEVFLGALREEGPLTLRMVLGWHRRLFEATKSEIAGKVRTYPVRISQSRFVPPEPYELDLLLTEFFDWCKNASKAIHPVPLAALVHLRLVTIHPFGDGNGRIARIAMNRELRRSDFPLFNIPYTGRRSYYGALERSQMKIDEVPFVRWFARQYLSRTSRPVGM